MNNETKNKHLTLNDRIEIQDMLYHNKNFRQIGAAIGKHPTTVSKEICKHIDIIPSLFTNTNFDSTVHITPCNILLKPPYVCNGCQKKRNLQI